MFSSTSGQPNVEFDRPSGFHIPFSPEHPVDLELVGDRPGKLGKTSDIVVEGGSLTALLAEDDLVANQVEQSVRILAQKRIGREVRLDQVTLTSPPALVLVGEQRPQSSSSGRRRLRRWFGGVGNVFRDGQGGQRSALVFLRVRGGDPLEENGAHFIDRAVINQILLQ